MKHTKKGSKMLTSDVKQMSGGIIFTVYEKTYPLVAAVL